MAATSSPHDPGQRAGPIEHARGFLRRHPVLCLLLLTPGIPEYLSGSSPLSTLLINPVLFFLQLAANLGLYGPGVLLVREALVRRRKSWPSLLAFGCAYAILEEGVALSTFFNPLAAPVGALGFYGHYLGVNWVWALGLLMVHTVYSLAVPIVLLSLALPETSGRPLLSVRQMAITAALLVLDVTLLLLVVLTLERFWMGWPLLAASLAVIGGLLLLGLRLGPGPAPAARAGPRRSPAVFFLLGLTLFPVTLLMEGLLESAAVPAAFTFAAVGAFYGLWGLLVLPSIGRERNARERLALSAGLLAPILLFGFVAGFPSPLGAVADAVAIAFLLWLGRRYPGRSALPTVPPHVLGPVS